MGESTNLLMLEPLHWVAERRRTHDEAMAAWQSHCLRQTIWEDAMIAGLIQINRNAITLTHRGRALLKGDNGRD